MSNLAQFIGSKNPPKSIVNQFSTNGFTCIQGADVASGTKKILSGVLTSGTLKTILSLSGSGSISFLSFYCANGTTRTVRCKVTIDGSVVFDSTSALNNSTAPAGGSVVGSFNTTGAAIPDVTYFNSSVLFEIASSLSETDGVGISVMYKTF